MLSQHPEAEEKVVQELDEAGLLATRERPQPRELEWGDLAALPYLSACIKVRTLLPA